MEIAADLWVAELRTAPENELVISTSRSQEPKGSVNSRCREISRSHEELANPPASQTKPISADTTTGLPYKLTFVLFTDVVRAFRYRRDPNHIR